MIVCRWRLEGSVIESILSHLTNSANSGPLPQQRDKGQEVFAVEPTLIQLLRRSIRSEDNSDSTRKETFKELAQEHRICHVGHLHLV